AIATLPIKSGMPRGRHQHKARGIPDFIGKVAIAHDTLRDELHIVARRAARCQRKAQSIGPILIHDFEWVNDIVLRLAHLLAPGVTYQSVQVDGMEGDLT